MKAVILSGGKGTRLMPLTANTPKPMLTIGDKPHLEHIIRLLQKYEITDIIFSTGYLHESIEKYFGNGNNFGVNITYREDGDMPLGTAGAIKNCEDLLDDGKDFIVFNGDILTDINLADMIKTHQENACSQKSITIALASVEDPSNFGVAFRVKNKITDFYEKPTSLVYGTLINAGVYMMNKDVLEDIPKNEFCMIEKDIFPKYAQNLDLYCYLEDGMYWIDIGTHERYRQANEDYSRSKDLFFKK